MKYDDIKQYSVILVKDYEINNTYPGSKTKGSRPYLVWYKKDSEEAIFLLSFTTKKNNNFHQIKIPEMIDSYLNVTSNPFTKIEQNKLKKIKKYELPRPINDKSVEEIRVALKEKNVLPIYD